VVRDRFRTVTEFIGTVSEFLTRFERVPKWLISAENKRLCTLTSSFARVD
jgi:hypothetical protein